MNGQQHEHGHGGRPCASTSSGDITSSSSELSGILPEQIIMLAFWCCVPAPECSLLPSRRWRPPLKMTVFFSPHASCHHAEEEDEEQQRRRSWALNLAAAGENGNPLLRDVSVQEVAEMVRLKALDCFMRQPHPRLPLYAITWGSEHGKAIFIVEKPTSTERAGAEPTIEVDRRTPKGVQAAGT